MSQDQDQDQDGDRAAAGARPPVEKLPSDPAAIEALIAQRRANLASTIDELADRARPSQIARRSAADVQGRARAFATTDSGELRSERLAALAAAFGAVLTMLLLLRRRRRRAR